VDRTVLWQLLLSVDLPHQIVDVFKALYTDSVSCVRAEGCESEWFPVNSAVRQGCVVANDAFLVPMDWLLEHLKLFGHVARDDKSQDHSRFLQACTSPAPRNWRRHPGRPRHTWLRSVEEIVNM